MCRYDYDYSVLTGPRANQTPTYANHLETAAAAASDATGDTSAGDNTSEGAVDSFGGASGAGGATGARGAGSSAGGPDGAPAPPKKSWSSPRAYANQAQVDSARAEEDASQGRLFTRRQADPRGGPVPGPVAAAGQAFISVEGELAAFLVPVSPTHQTSAPLTSLGRQPAGVAVAPGPNANANAVGDASASASANGDGDAATDGARAGVLKHSYENVGSKRVQALGPGPGSDHTLEC